ELTEPIARRHETAPLGAILRVLDAPSTPAAFRLSEGACVIGSAPTCDLAIDLATVSRTHAELTLAHEGVIVRDLGSRNGTWFHGQRVEKMVLGFGAQIRLGAATIAVEADAEALARAPDFPGTFYHGIVGVSPALRRL